MPSLRWTCLGRGICDKPAKPLIQTHWIAAKLRPSKAFDLARCSGTDGIVALGHEELQCPVSHSNIGLVWRQFAQRIIITREAKLRFDKLCIENTDPERDGRTDRAHDRRFQFWWQLVEKTDGSGYFNPDLASLDIAIRS